MVHVVRMTLIIATLTLIVKVVGVGRATDR